VDVSSLGVDYGPTANTLTCLRGRNIAGLCFRYRLRFGRRYWLFSDRFSDFLREGGDRHTK
jgi:hypothetical protein